LKYFYVGKLATFIGVICKCFNTYIINYLLASSNKYLKQLEKAKKQSKIEILKKEILNSWINYKGVLFEYQNILTMIEEKTKDSDLKQKIKKYRTFTQYLANLRKQQTSTKNSKKIQEKITETQNKISKLEISLGNNKTSIKIQELFGLKDINVTDILSKLKANQLYIDFAKTDKNYYIFTLNKNNEINFIQIDEENTKKLDENIKKLKYNNEKMVQKIKNKTVEQKKKKLKEESQVILSKLYNRLVSKYLVKELKDKDSLIISPDGLLNSLPFEALYHNGRYLIQDYQISYISSGREFVRQTKREKGEPKYEMICFGDPDFNTTLPISDIRKLGKQNEKKKLDTWEQYTEFSPIGNAEVEMIRELYKNDTLVYEGKRATVKNLMSVESPKILHLSTHGKFLNNTNIENPMLRGGLAFTGANKKFRWDCNSIQTLCS
jgi:CHAT domain-containing protein